jgi:hypothetical protein
MAEDPDEKLSRVKMMVKDRGETWDLSPNDKAALRHVLGMVNWMAEALTEYWSDTFENVIERVGCNVERLQNRKEDPPRANGTQDGD